LASGLEVRDVRQWCAAKYPFIFSDEHGKVRGGAIHSNESTSGADQLHFSESADGLETRLCEPHDFSRCPVCHAAFDLGLPIHSGRYLLIYKLHVCYSCYDRYREGWPKEAEAGMTRYLRAQNRELPERNAYGRLPRGI
jgi:hypothetical protein